MRQKYESKDVHIEAGIIIIIHQFSRAVLYNGRAERACSHTCKLPIIHPDTEKDIGIERQTKTWNKRHTYRRTISDNIAEHSHKQSKKKRQKHGSRDVYIHQEWMMIYSDTGVHIQRQKNERQTQVKWRTYTRKISGNIREYWDREKHREKCGSRDEPIHGQSVTILPKTDRGIQREDRQKHGSRDVPIHVQWVTI